MTINFVLVDTRETVGIEAGKSVMIARVGQPAASPALTITGPRQVLLALFFLKMPIEKLQQMGVKVEGDPQAMTALQNALDPIPDGFNIVEP